MSKQHRPVELEYRKIGPGLWRKWNPMLGLYSTLKIEYDGAGRKTVHVKLEHPQHIMDAILDRNVAMQNAWKGKFGADLVTQTTSMPIAVHQQIMKQCGFQQGHGYDEKKFRQIMNDRDNYKLKTVPGRI